MYRSALIPCLLLSLSACGGSSNGLQGLNDRYTAEGESNVSEVVKEFADGSSALSSYGKFKTQNGESTNTFYILSVTEDNDTLIDTFNGVVQLSTSQYTDFNGTSFYFYRGDGINSNGQDMETYHYGHFRPGLVDTGLVYALIDGELSVMAFGSKVGTMPSGTQTYRYGDTFIGYGDGAETSYDGLTLVANFNTLKGSMTGRTENLYVSATDFNINIVSGEFSGGTAKIGNLSDSSDYIDAEILGVVGGDAGHSVHGTVYQSSPSDLENVSVFYALDSDIIAD